MQKEEVSYIASPTISRFHLDDDSLVRALIGPLGSGKSVACVMDLLKRAMEQRPNRMGERKTKWAIVRNTYRELADTTIQTFFDWIPESTGLFIKMDMCFKIDATLDDGTTLKTEFLFRALDRPKDVKKLLSLELTGMWINEAREVPKAVLEMGFGRTGRYPSKREGGPSWYGVILDSNPPDTDHWLYTLFEEACPDRYRLYHQPSGLSPKAENLENLVRDYYKNIALGRDAEWVKVYVEGRYGFVMDGKPVYPEYKDNIHAIETTPPLTGKGKPTLYVGIDFGLTPAATFVYQSPSGRLYVIDELVTFDMGAVNFGRLLRTKCNQKYPNCEIYFYGDPSGDERAQTDEQTPFMILQKQGIHAIPTYTNDPSIRREVVAEYLGRLDFNGEPAFAITPGAPTLRKAMSGGFKYKRMQVVGDDKYHDKPDKNKYSHVAESLQYAILGAFGGSSVVGGYAKKEVDYSAANRMIR